MKTKDKKIGHKELAKLLKRCEVMPDERLLDVYRNIDWEDFRVIDVARLCGEIGTRGYEIVEDTYNDDGSCIVEFKPVPIMNKEEKVA